MAKFKMMAVQNMDLCYVVTFCYRTDKQHVFYSNYYTNKTLRPRKTFDTAVYNEYPQQLIYKANAERSLHGLLDLPQLLIN